MKITINVDGRDHTIRVPLALLLSLVRGKAKENGKKIKIDRAARRKLKATIRDTKSRYGDLAIVEVRSSKGEEVTIRL